MKTLLAAVCVALLSGASAQQPPPPPEVPQPSPAARALREVFDFVLGSWELEPQSAGGLAGRFSFEMDLAGRAVLHRIQVTGAPAPGSGGRANELLLVIYAEASQLKALYLDNDGKVVRFDVGFAHDTGSVTFSSQPAADRPRERLTYRPLSRDRLEVTSEASLADGRGPLTPTSTSTWLRRRN